MLRPVSVTLASILSLLLLWTASVRAEDEILKLVPEQALGLVLVNRPAAADAKLQQLGQQMKLPIPSLLAKLQGPEGIRRARQESAHRHAGASAQRRQESPDRDRVVPGERLRQVP